MCIKYSCFISYPHTTQGTFFQLFIQQLKGTLENYLSTLLDEEVYLDRKRLLPGYMYDDALAQAICQSVCMIVVFTQLYEKHRYCLREFLAMEKLEEERKQKLGEKYDRQSRMIIPIIIKPIGTTQGEEEEQLPAKFQGLQYCDLSRFFVSGMKIATNKDYNQLIIDIANQIYRHYKVLKELDDNGMLKQDCSSFKLPDEQDVIRLWGKKPSRPVGFPMRGDH